MIKKNTKIIIDGKEEVVSIQGGMPLSIGDILSFKKDSSEKAGRYEVIDKQIDIIEEGEDFIVNIEYVFKKH